MLGRWRLETSNFKRRYCRTRVFILGASYLSFGLLDSQADAIDTICILICVKQNCLFHLTRPFANLQILWQDTLPLCRSSPSLTYSFRFRDSLSRVQDIPSDDKTLRSIIK